MYSKSILDHPKKLMIIPLPNPNAIYHLFHKTMVGLVFKLSGELFPLPSYRHSYPCFPTWVPISLHPYNS